jgi:hypothetical protein
MKIKIGKIKNSVIDLPKFLISLSVHNYEAQAFWKFGQLYHGYWGIYFIIKRVHFNLWIHHIEERRASA